ncbi:MAG: hypothetical protein ABR591_00160 [Candidatus Velthaea sp.]
MGAVIAFVIRLVGYALLVGIPTRIAEYFWQREGLDTVDVLQHAHALAITIVMLAPVVLALFGFGALRRLAIFIALYLAGAAVTAPFAFARFSVAG